MLHARHRPLQELAEQQSVKKPEYWDDRVTSPARVHVAEGTPEWDFVLSKFHNGGFNKPVHAIERVQVRDIKGGIPQRRCQLPVSLSK